MRSKIFFTTLLGTYNIEFSISKFKNARKNHKYLAWKLLYPEIKWYFINAYWKLGTHAIFVLHSPLWNYITWFCVIWSYIMWLSTQSYCCDVVLNTKLDTVFDFKTTQYQSITFKATQFAGFELHNNIEIIMKPNNVIVLHTTLQNVNAFNLQILHISMFSLELHNVTVCNFKIHNCVRYEHT